MARKHQRSIVFLNIKSLNEFLKFKYYHRKVQKQKEKIKKDEMEREKKRKEDEKRRE